ncbi:MAG: 1,4-alpha-glucan branching protein GlgB [Anaerolineae bacterium]
MQPHPDALNALAYADHGAPADILGAHPYQDTTTFRAFRPDAVQMQLVIEDQDPITMQKIHDGGIFEITLTTTLPQSYHYLVTNHFGHTFTYYDPYSAPSVFGDMDYFLFGEGRHRNIYDLMGAHPRVVNGVSGVNFAVWAPNARRVSVVGNFNYWDARYHPMHQRKNGIWELFVPGLGLNEPYKFALRSHHRGYEAEKSDPYAFFAEKRPQTASVVVDLDQYEWNDAEWMEKRSQTNVLTAPMAIYEVHLGSWRRNAEGNWLTYRELAETLIPYVKDMGYTHIEIMPVAEHPFDGSWGYQVTGYYAPTSRYGTPADFMYFVDQCHQAGIGVILDWVPAHFPKDGHALSYFDGTHLYSHEDPRLGEQPDWGTYIFNYGRNEVRNFLIGNALFWLKKYHIDGLRVDAVSSMVYLDFSRKAGEWIPNKYGGRENLEAVAFLREFNMVVHEECPGAFTVAEESTSWPAVSRPVYIGGLGFTLKWNMGWMHDTLNYVKLDPIYRRYHHNQLTFMMMYAYTENFVLSLSHDEVVHGKGSLINKAPGDWWQKFATLRLLMGYQYTIVGKKLNFMGHEIAQWREWSEARQLDWELLSLPTHQGVQQFIKDLNRIYTSHPALHELDYDPAGCYFIEANDLDRSVYVYARFSTDRAQTLVIVLNFTPVVYEEFRIGVPAHGVYEEILNSDHPQYGGSGVINPHALMSQATPWHHQDQSVILRLPPLGMILLRLKPTQPTDPEL